MNLFDHKTLQSPLQTTLATLASATWEEDTRNARYQNRLEEAKLEFARLWSLPNLWPFSWRQGRNEWIEIIKREVGEELADILSKIPQG